MKAQKLLRKRIPPTTCKFMHRFDSPDVGANYPGDVFRFRDRTAGFTPIWGSLAQIYILVFTLGFDVFFHVLGER